MPLTGVTGWPVGHSRSPALHQAAFDALGLAGWHSQLLPLPPELFGETIRALSDSGFIGVNVTIPHKEAALAVADRCSTEANQIGAVNTLAFSSDGITGHNTDWAAVADAIDDRLGHGGSASALVLGAGGSARAAVHALNTCGITDVAVYSRSPERADLLCEDLGCRSVAQVEIADVIVNCTPVGLDGSDSDQLSALPVGRELISQSRVVCDLVYRHGGTALSRLAESAAVDFIGGLEVLARQGARSIEVWTGRRPPLEPLLAAVADDQPC